MEMSKAFYYSILDSLPEQLAVIDLSGKIIYVNDSWQHFGDCNEYNEKVSWLNQNYLTTCEKAAKAGDEDAKVVVEGLTELISSEMASFYFEYPCHSPTEQRWFMMRAVPFYTDSSRCIVITHQNITKRKLAEQRAAELAVLDPLTGIANRRKFDEYLALQWRELARSKKSLSLIFIDIDHFKLINDNYGHPTGDQVLVEVASVLKGFARRPYDICARYGGEEFMLLLSHTNLSQARKIAQRVQSEIRNYSFVKDSPEFSQPVTISIGLATTQPTPDTDMYTFIDFADKLLYQAKNGGRDRIVSSAINYSEKANAKV
ncbi:sensor domain-containing diguanylate cyclase [Vibrio sp. SCSIO 43137]|uniref:sensor domain-containing diguanylate cyclase n=1 Tax=Vibrio sp. SCSIO 43137 TaxID=3021011 RepID=UPI0023072664|nr:sensor domain-containing diguanylate cyclase [Vibrio sp. SCSIO 43137]WCE32226.1 sensor domain-containing diguanylate cyclase [Vibrio sp. SCSIO 43137]